MDGTEKQVKWATDIRVIVLQGIDDRKAELTKSVELAQQRIAGGRDTNGTYQRGATDYQNRIGLLNEGRGLLENIDSAKWWIDNGRVSWQYSVMTVLHKDLQL